MISIRVPSDNVRLCWTVDVKIFKTTKRNIKVTLENMGTVEVGLGVCVGREEGGRSGERRKRWPPTT